MRKTNTNLSNYDDFRKYSVEEIGNMFGIGKTKTRELLQSRLLPRYQNRTRLLYFQNSNSRLSKQKCG